MAERDNVATRTREAPGSVLAWARIAVGCTLVAVATAIAAGAVRAHRFETVLPDVRDGAPPALGVEVGDDLPFEPFTVAVIGPVRGDHATLERALRRSRELGADLIVVAGDVLPASARALGPLAEVLLHEPGAVLLAGPRDAALSFDADERIASLLTAPESWEIHTRECVVVGEPGLVAVRAPGGDREWSVPVPEGDGSTVRLEVLHVQSRDVATRDALDIDRGASPGGWVRQVSLSTLWPLAGSGAGLAAVLLGAFLTALVGLRLARRTPGLARTTAAPRSPVASPSRSGWTATARADSSAAAARER